ncbi:MAG: septum formation initiator family protein [Candidatus Eisenbacteria bacterium]|nr:septum formation initiator family protein [Candidatus Eisenbacteria bacterium]
MTDWRAPDRLRFLRVDHRAVFARKQFVRLVLVLAAVWVVHVFLISDHSVFRHTLLEEENQKLRAEIARTESVVDSLDLIAEELEHDRERIERVARERYHLSASGEKSYIFVSVEKSDRPRLLEEALARRRAEREEQEEAERKGERH